MSRPIPLTTGPKKSVSAKADAAILRMGKAKRVCSLSEFEARTGFDRGTVARWIKAGCPTERVGAKGEAVLVDMRDVMLWREELARAEGRKEAVHSGPEEGVDLDAQLKQAQIDYQQIRIAERTGLLVLRADVEQNNAITHNAYRTSIDGQPDRVERILLGFPPDAVRRAKNEIRASCRAALREAQVNMDNAFRQKTRSKLEDIGADLDDFDEDDADLEALDAAEDTDGIEA